MAKRGFLEKLTEKRLAFTRQVIVFFIGSYLLVKLVQILSNRPTDIDFLLSNERLPEYQIKAIKGYVSWVAPKWRDQLKMAKKCLFEGHGFRIPNPVELMDFDTDCNTIIERLNFDARFLWLPLIGLAFMFIMFIINKIVLLILNIGKELYSNRYWNNRGIVEKMTLMQIVHTEYRKVVPSKSRLNFDNDPLANAAMIQSLDPQYLQYCLERSRPSLPQNRRMSSLEF